MVISQNLCLHGRWIAAGLEVHIIFHWTMWVFQTFYKWKCYILEIKDQNLKKMDPYKTSYFWRENGGTPGIYLLLKGYLGGLNS